YGRSTMLQCTQISGINIRYIDIQERSPASTLLCAADHYHRIADGEHGRSRRIEGTRSRNTAWTKATICCGSFTTILGVTACKPGGMCLVMRILPMGLYHRPVERRKVEKAFPAQRLRR